MDQRMKYSYAAVCATGRVRTENQDRIYLNGTICGGGYAQTDGTGRKQGLFAVADGMGGQAQGAQAAQAALEALPPKKCWSPEAVLQAYDAGNRAICDQIGKIGKRSGATLTTLLLADGEAYAANIGDSRCYLYRDGCLSRLSEDHTAVQRLIALGIIEPAEAKTHPERHRLTQHLGIFPDELIIQPHTVQLPVRPGDRFLLCSDGLTDMLEEEDLCALLRSQTAAPACAAALYQLAMQRAERRARPGAAFMRLYQEKLQYQHDRAAADGDLKQICAEPCGGDAQHQRGKARDGGACGVYNGREGHDGQRHIRHVEQKRAQEAAFDGPADERQRQLPDEERHGGADQNIQISFTVHPDFPPSAPARPSPGKAAPLPTQLKSSAKSSACPRTAS